MKKCLIAMLTAAACAFVPAQMASAQDYSKPEATEIWGPKPPVVTPGNPFTDGAPSDAIVLFDGTNLDAWINAANGSPALWPVHDGIVTVDKKQGDILTKETFGSFQMHIEWCIPPMRDIYRDQGRGNSGVYLQGMYELQILDSYENETYVNGQAGSIYKQTAPLVNAMRAPGEWNSYDIIYTAPVFNEDGTYQVPPRVTVLHNGVLIQNNTEILGTTAYIGLPKVIPHGDGRIRLQAHGDRSPGISFRNIWIRRL